MAKKTEQDLVQVKLLTAHTHAGKVYQAGEFIKVSPHTADWLKALNAATPSDAVAVNAELETLQP